MTRILLISDFHWMVVPPGQQKGQKIKGISRLVEAIINLWKRWNIPNTKKAIEKISGLGQFDYVVFAGDIAECEYNERGIVTQKDFDVIRWLFGWLRKKFSKPENFYSVPGDHELGYKLPLSVDPKGGVSLMSVINHQKIFGPLYKSFRMGRNRFILLSSSMMIQDFEQRFVVEKNELLRIRERQTQFIADKLSQSKEGDNVFVFLHDPDALEIFDKLVFENCCLKNVNIKVFCGHLHAESSLGKYEKLGRMANNRYLSKIISLHPNGKKIIDWAKGNLRRLEIFKKYDLQVIPATGGMMGQGGGFLILNLFDDGSYEIEKYKT